MKQQLCWVFKFESDSNVGGLDGFLEVSLILMVIAVNGKFPGPVLNVTTNYNVVVNVKNKLDEDLLVT
ncbi:hypothetical protein HAX54_012849, partial [Datura stramonium]|nr:hypothetical protein [Datura stramonium]